VFNEMRAQTAAVASAGTAGHWPVDAKPTLSVVEQRNS
jgi:hypothetical protein